MHCVVTASSNLPKNQVGEAIGKKQSYVHLRNQRRVRIGSAVLAVVAAAFWFYTSWISRGTFTQTVIVELDRIFTLQARCNAIAAFCAALAALLQIVVLRFMPVCRAFA